METKSRVVTLSLAIVTSTELPPPVKRTMVPSRLRTVESGVVASGVSAAEGKGVAEATGGSLVDEQPATVRAAVRADVRRRDRAIAPYTKSASSAKAGVPVERGTGTVSQVRPIGALLRCVNPIYDFQGQVALVTGAAAGMGLDTARAFAACGAAVVLADIEDDAVRAAADELANAGHQALGLACDVADEDRVAAVMERTVETFGRLDLAFNNAGIMIPPSDAADEPAERFERVNAVNLRGVWNCMKHELRVMREQGSGAIVNCSSLGGLVGLPGRASYHATKHGVIGLTKSAALEYAPRGVRINAVCPGTIETPMVADMLSGQPDAMAEIMKQQPIGRLGRAEEVAAAVLWLCSPAASFVIGVGLPVDGGFTAH